MIIFHGSYMEITTPDVYHSRDNVDFGKGFYITPIWEQAVKWATRFRRHKGTGIVSTYKFDLEEVRKSFRLNEFEGYTEEWLEFITTNRRLVNKSDYDVIIGGVANDKVFNTIELYFEGLIEKTEAIKRLQFEKPNLQICIRNQEVIDQYLFFMESEEI